MRVSLRGSLVLFCAALTLVSMPASARAEGSLFVNLTSSEMNRSVMAISIAQKALAKSMPVTIFLNVEGVRLADVGLPLSRHVTGKTPREMLQEFMNAGGKVYACQMCMNLVGGFQEEELMKGVEVADESNLFPLLFASDTKVLSY
jgi:predicted peroxiredoxin